MVRRWRTPLDLRVTETTDTGRILLCLRVLFVSIRELVRLVPLDKTLLRCIYESRRLVRRDAKQSSVKFYIKRTGCRGDLPVRWTRNGCALDSVKRKGEG